MENCAGGVYIPVYDQKKNKNCNTVKKNIFLAIAIGLPIAAFAQGNNTGMGGADGNYESLAHRVFNLEKKTDAFNVYFN